MDLSIRSIVMGDPTRPTATVRSLAPLDHPPRFDFRHVRSTAAASSKHTALAVGGLIVRSSLRVGHGSVTVTLAFWTAAAAASGVTSQLPSSLAPSVDPPELSPLVNRCIVRPPSITSDGYTCLRWAIRSTSASGDDGKQSSRGGVSLVPPGARDSRRRCHGLEQRS